MLTHGTTKRAGKSHMSAGRRRRRSTRKMGAKKMGGKRKSRRSKKSRKSRKSRKH